jgi:hypothetical protein
MRAIQLSILAATWRCHGLKTYNRPATFNQYPIPAEDAVTPSPFMRLSFDVWDVLTAEQRSLDAWQSAGPP